VEVEVEEDNPLQSEGTTTVGERSILEGVDVVAQGIDGDAHVLDALLKEDGAVYSLSPTGDLLSTHEEIIAASIPGIVLTGHGIEGTSIIGVAMKHIEVSVILLSDDST
jgi:hypothetical protein